MYIPKIYKQEDLSTIIRFIKSFPFAIIISQSNNKIIASHLPLEIKTQNGKISLIGHISKANTLLSSFENDEDVLVIFQGPHSYISSTWYTKENVPTWNYIAVHAYGKVDLLSREDLITSLKALMNHYETKTKTFLKLDDLDPKMINKELRGIAGFEISVKSMEASYKLSQNRSEQSFKNIIANLEKSNDQNEIGIAKAMKKNKKS